MAKAKAVRRVPVKLQRMSISADRILVTSVVLEQHRACPCLRHLAGGKRRRRIERRGKFEEDGRQLRRLRMAWTVTP